MGVNLDLTILKNISPQEGTLWEFYFLDVPKSLKSRKGSGALGALQTASSVVDTALGLTYYKYLVSDVNFNPIRNLDSEYDVASRRHHFTGAGAYDDVSITFRETEEFSANLFLQNLMNRSYSNFRSSFVSGDPTITGILTFFKKNETLPFTRNRGNLADISREISENARILKTGKVFILKDMMLKNAGELSLSYSNTDPVTVSSVFSVNEIVSIGPGSLLNTAGLLTDLTENLVGTTKEEAAHDL